MLPVWDKLPTENVRIYRVLTTDGDLLIGRVIPEDMIDATLHRLDASSHPIYQFRAELDDFKPKIWRRFQVANDVTMARLGYILQVMFEMTSSHLMAIEVPFADNYRAYFRAEYPDEPYIVTLGSEYDNLIYRYEIPNDLEPFLDPHRNVRVDDATQVRIRHAVSNPNERLNFNYDFGDDWWVTVTLEEVFYPTKQSLDLIGRKYLSKGSGTQ